MKLILLSMLQACTEKEEETETTDTGSETETTVSNATFEYECYDDDTAGGMWCDRLSETATLSDSTFSTYLVDGELTEVSCSNLCQTELNVWMDFLCSCDYQGAAADGNHPVTCEYTQCAVEGRVHGDIKKLEKSTGYTELGIHFARGYHAEASSVDAFLQLRKELAFHQASKELQDRCFLAAKEEIVHAQLLAKLAKLHQGQLPTLDFGRFQPRSLFALALDNAVEGCIFETFSSLRALQQANNATDQVIAKAMKIIALDEMKHAELAWDIHKSLISKLSNVERDIIRKAQKEAIQLLLKSADVTSDLSKESQKKLGLKDTNKLREVFSKQWLRLAA